MGMDNSANEKQGERSLEEIANECYKERDYTRALEYYNKAIQCDSTKASLYVGKGNCLRKQELLEHAKASYQLALSFDPQSAGAYIGICYIYVASRDFSKAWNAHKKAVALAPMSATVYNCKGWILYGMYKNNRALEAFEQAILLATDADNIEEYYYNKGLALLRLNRYDEALDAYYQALRYDSVRPTLEDLEDFPLKKRILKSKQAINEAEELLHIHQYKDALHLFNVAIQFNPNSVLAYVGKGEVLLKLAKYNDAYFVFCYACKLLDNPRAHFGKGKALLGLKRYSEAITAFTSALRLNSQMGNAYAELGNAYLALAESHKALQAYEDAIRLGVEDAEMYFNAAHILYTESRFTEAREYCEKALKLDTEYVATYKLLGQILFISGFYKEALNIYKRAYQKNLHTPEIFLRVGDCLAIDHGLDKAEAFYARAISILEQEENIDKLWPVIHIPGILYRPTHVQVALLYLFLRKVSSNKFFKEAYWDFGNFYYEYFSDVYSLNSLEEPFRKFQTILSLLSPADRPQALQAVAHNDNLRLANLLIMLAPYELSGLDACARDLLCCWSFDAENDTSTNPSKDALVLPLYQVASTYNVPEHEADFFYLRFLMAHHRYSEAEPLLLRHMQQEHPVPDILWFLTVVLEQLDRPVDTQIEALKRFVTAVVEDQRLKDAWLRLGALYATVEGNGEEAILAYQEAERLGASVPALQAFRLGDWDAIPALRTHPDSPFPTVVVLDIESDYQPADAAASRIFEIGAVRMKGRTELACYHPVIRRSFVVTKVAHQQSEAQELSVVVQQLRQFIGTALVVGHNILAFDARLLKEIGLELVREQIIDTLVLARLLYPDSIHHHLRLLCAHLHLNTERQWHTALDDARACAEVLHALGDELVRRGDPLLAGFRAFTIPGSAFDRAVLQPRGIAADPSIPWLLDPSPMPVHILRHVEGRPASPKMLEALGRQGDVLVERYDPDAAYVQALPENQRCVVTVGSRTRLERMLAQEARKLFVLPHPQTLLCPDRVRCCIEKAETAEEQLTLFCLYQASHNHDARTLYPFRLPEGGTAFPALSRLRTLLHDACCGDDCFHVASCPAFIVAKQAATATPLLLSTHENLIALQQHQQFVLTATLIVIDDIDELQMHFAEYLAERIKSTAINRTMLTSTERSAFSRLQATIESVVQRYSTSASMYERLALHSLVPDLTQAGEQGEPSVLTSLEEAGPVTRQIAHQLRPWCDEAAQDVIADDVLRACWLELHFTPEMTPESWTICRLHCRWQENFQHAFKVWFWQPYAQHIVCGTALTLGGREAALPGQFLRRFFGLSDDLPLLQDARPQTRILLPTQGRDNEMIGSASFLRRRSWALEVGRFLYRQMASEHQSFVLTLHETSVARAIAAAFQEHTRVHPGDLPHHILAPSLDWSSTKISERMTNKDYLSLIIIPPALRRSLLDTPVDMEATGPLRFLNRRDPVVAAFVSVFSSLYPDEGPLNAYLLPQALLEFKARLSSPARTHIVLDNSLSAKIYRDEVFALMEGVEKLETLPSLPSGKRDMAEQFDALVAQQLERNGFRAQMQIADADLQLTLQTVWNTNTFRSFALVDGSSLSQRDIIQRTLNERDQLVIIATGGGKSLCFQLPAILLAEDVVPRVTLVISPLVALMHDQVEKLRSKGIFSVAVINSSLSASERRAIFEGIERGDYSIIYMAPEQIYTRRVCEVLQTREIGLIAVDEAHCVSQWGHNFRTDYFALKRWIALDLCKGQQRDFPVMALTATARQAYQGLSQHDVRNEVSTVQDIVEQLALRTQKLDISITSPERPELLFQVEQIRLQCSQTNCSGTLEYQTQTQLRCSVCGAVREEYKDELWEIKRRRLVELLRGELRSRWDQPQTTYQRGIIYCRTRAATEKLAEEVARDIPALQGRVRAFHAGIDDDIKQDVYEQFIRDEVNGVCLIVATNAFGMGIDAARLGFVIHFDVPATPEAYYQEAGRAGRNFHEGEKAQCILFYHEADLESQRWLMQQNTITEQDVLNVYQALCKIQQQRESAEDLPVTEEENEVDLFITEDELALQARVEIDQINTLLYYLEYHTTLYGNRVIERGKNGSHAWQMRLTENYRQLLISPLTARAKQLLSLFLAPGQFSLSAQYETTLDLNELLQYLRHQHGQQWKHAGLNTLEDALALLMQKGIVMRTTRGSLEWRQPLDTIPALLDHVEHALVSFIRYLPNQRALHAGHKISVKLNTQIEQLRLQTITPEQFLRFLSMLALDKFEETQLFERLKLDISSGKPGIYILQLKHPGEKQTQAVIHRICAGLRETYTMLRKLSSDKQQPFDLFLIAQKHQERQRLHQHLFWLDTLGLLTYRSEPLFGQARYITLLHKGDGEQVRVDLTSLYRQEVYREKKLAFMRDYAQLPENERSSLFERYFLGKIPLVDPYQMPASFTEQQQAAVCSTQGYQLIEGPAGSGKTTVLLEHLKYLMEYCLIPAQRILVLAHNKSTIEKIHATLEASEVSIKDGQLPEMLTLNAFANRIFQQHCTLLQRRDGIAYYGKSGNIQFLSEAGEREILCYTLALLDFAGWTQEARIAEPIWQCINLENPSEAMINECLEAIRLFRQACFLPTKQPDLEEITRILTPMKKISYTEMLYYIIYDKHLQTIAANHYYTFDDQLLFASALLKQYPYLRERYICYEHIVIDEFQDITPAQIALLKLLTQRHHNLFAVGDSDQYIRPDNARLLNCKRKLQQVAGIEGYTVHTLKHMFRAAPEIGRFLDAIRKLPSNAPVRQHMDRAYELSCEQLKLIAIPTRFPEKGYHQGKVLDRFLGIMLQEVLKQYHQLDTQGSVAFIVARKEWFEQCKHILQGQHVPFAILDNQSLYQASYIAPIFRYFRLIVDQTCDDDIKWLLRFCLASDISFIQVKNLEELARQKKLPLISALMQTSIAKKVFSQRQLTIIHQHLALLRQFSASSCVMNVWYALSRLEQGPIVRATAHDEQVKGQKKVFEELKTYSIQQALDHIKHHVSFVEPSYKEKTLILTTIDQAKSQEFDTVFLLGADTIPTHKRFYVAASRARQRLFLFFNPYYSPNYEQRASEYAKVASIAREVDEFYDLGELPENLF